MERPSQRYIKHGWLNKGEYHQGLHTFGKNMNERNIKTHSPVTTYYTPEEMEKMKQEITIAECPICFGEINDDRCRVCENGHKFHNRCSPSQNNEVSICPVCRNEKVGSCNNIYTDIASGGKKSKRKNKITRRKMYKKRIFVKKTFKKTRNVRKTRK
jgi:hypothetical protein